MKLPDGRYITITITYLRHLFLIILLYFRIDLHTYWISFLVWMQSQQQEALRLRMCSQQTVWRSNPWLVSSHQQHKTYHMCPEWQHDPKWNVTIHVSQYDKMTLGYSDLSQVPAMTSWRRRVCKDWHLKNQMAMVVVLEKRKQIVLSVI